MSTAMNSSPGSTASSVDPTTGIRAYAADDSTAQPSIGELIGRLSEQTTRLVRDELRLAQAELTAKGKRAGIGAGMFGAAGMAALFGAICLVGTAVAALSLVWPVWAAALVIGIGLMVVAGIAALMGKGQVKKAVPPVPEEAVEGLREDVKILQAAQHRHAQVDGRHGVRS